MKTYQHDGSTITLTAPTGGVSSGDVIVLEDDNATGYIAVAKSDAGVGEEYEAQTEGVVELPKVDGVAFADGERVYWDEGDSEINDAPTGNVAAGRCFGAVGTGDETIFVKINQR